MERRYETQVGWVSASQLTRYSTWRGNIIVMQRKKQKKRRSIYTTKFIGINQFFLESFRAIESPDREKAFYLLVTMMLISGWNFHDPAMGFICTQRSLRNAMGWAYSTIRKYRQVLEDNCLLVVEEEESGKYKNSLIHTLSCHKLGIKPSEDRSKKKYNRPYDGRFWGFTKLAFDNLRAGVPHEKCPRALWLLANMLVMGDWTVYKSEKPFRWSERVLQDYVCWHRKTVREYRDLLVDAEVLHIYWPGGRGVPAMYQADTEFLGITWLIKNPTKVIDLEKHTKARPNVFVGTP